MTEIIGLLQDSLARLLTEAWGTGADPAALWDALARQGMAKAAASEVGGGAGLGLGDGLALVSTFSGVVPPAPVPFPETLLAAHLLDEASLAVPDGKLTLGPVLAGDGLRLDAVSDGWRISGTVTRMPWGREAAFAVLAVQQDNAGGPALALVALEQASIVPGLNLAGEPRDTLTLSRAPIVALADFAGGDDGILPYGAALRATQIAATCASVLDLCLDHATTRVQFGRAIGKFQAVQQNLAIMAGHVAAAAGAAGLAAEAAGTDRFPLAAALAKTRAGEAAGTVVALAHQTIAAMGFADEHALPHLTKRLMAWREEMGTERHWAAYAGRQAFAAGGEAYWRLVSGT